MFEKIFPIFWVFYVDFKLLKYLKYEFYEIKVMKQNTMPFWYGIELLTRVRGCLQYLMLYSNVLKFSRGDRLQVWASG